MDKSEETTTYIDYQGNTIEVKWDTGERWTDRGCLETLALLPFLGIIFYGAIQWLK